VVVVQHFREAALVLAALGRNATLRSLVLRDCDRDRDYIRIDDEAAVGVTSALKQNRGFYDEVSDSKGARDLRDPEQYETGSDCETPTRSMIGSGGRVFAGCAAWGIAASPQPHSLECAVHVLNASQ